MTGFNADFVPPRPPNKSGRRVSLGAGSKRQISIDIPQCEKPCESVASPTPLPYTSMEASNSPTIQIRTRETPKMWMPKPDQSVIDRQQIIGALSAVGTRVIVGFGELRA